MTRLLGNPQLIRWVLLLALLMPVFAAPMHSQESAPPPPTELKTENSPAASPEQLRQAQIEADTKKLYQLCAELRAEVAKTYKETLSMKVLKKAEEVEALAKSLRELMRKDAASKH